MTSPLVIDATIAVNDPAWEREVRNLQPYIKHIVQVTLKHMQASLPASVHALNNEPVGLAIVFTSDEEVRELNAQFRGKDTPTNVLSFSADVEAPQPAGQEVVLGDVILAYGVVAAEAGEQGKPFVHHMTHMVVHGLLHLLGFDHVAEAQAQQMEQHEREILAMFSIPDPYSITGPLARHAP